MMKCPKCSTRARVLDTRSRDWGRRRRYECVNMHRFVTIEYVQEACMIPNCDYPAMFGEDFCSRHIRAGDDV